MNSASKIPWQQRLGALTDVQRQRLAQRLGLPATSTRLIAYLVATPESEGFIDEVDLREFLTDKLSSAMMPSQFVYLDQMPRGATGKLDRRALPDPPLAPVDGDNALVLPSTAVELDIAAMWTEVLDIEPIGIHDNFFDIGGDSLLVTRLISRIRQAYQLEVSPRLIFEKPTLFDLATEIEILQVAEQAPCTEPSHIAEQRSNMPLSVSQRRYWFLAQLAPDSPAYNMSLAYKIDGPLGSDALQRSLSAISTRHEIFRMRFPMQSGEPVQCADAPLPVLQQLDVRELEGLEKTRAIENEIQSVLWQPFNLHHGPMIRMGLIRTSDQESIFLLSIHHIVFDGSSFNLFCRELQQFYANNNASLQTLPIQYADYASWERHRLDDGLLNSQLSYWKQKFEPLPQALELPFDHIRPKMQSYAGAWKHFSFSSETWDQVKIFSHQQGITPFMMLLSVYAILLCRLTGQDDVVIGVPVSNRMRADVEGLIGNFTNTLALRIDLSNNPSLTTLMARVREIALDGYTHQELPFESLVEQLRLKSDASRSPLFQVMFDLQSASLGAMQLDGVQCTPMTIEKAVTMFDLSLAMAEEDDGLRASFDYDTALFDVETIERWVEDYTMLLKSCLTDPEQPIQSLPLVSTNLPETGTVSTLSNDHSFQKPVLVGPIDTIEFHLVKIWEDILGVDGFGVNDNFFDLGGHSLLAVILFDKITAAFGKRLPLDALWFGDGTISHLAGLIRESLESANRSRLVPMRSTGSKAPLFVVHTMGGHLFHYSDLVRHLHPGQPVYGLQAKGIYGINEPHRSIEAIAADCIVTMRKQQAVGPYRIAGFSSGGITAIEMAQQLRASGQSVELLALLDTYAPGLAPVKFLERLRYRMEPYFDFRYLQERIYFSVLTLLGLGHRRALSNAGEAHRWAHWAYDIQAFPGDLELFLADGSLHQCGDPKLGWSHLVCGELTIHRMPGKHGGIVKPPRVQELAERLQSRLDTVQKQ